MCQAISGNAEESAWNVLSAEDCQRLVHLAEKEGVAPLLHRRLKDCKAFSGMPVDARRRLEQGGYASAAHNAVLFQALEELEPALAEQGIEAVPLKGAWLARHIYPEMGLRRMSDLDLLVQPGSLKAALGVLEGLGYRLQKITYHAMLLGGPAGDLVVELHWTLPGGQALPDWLWHDLIAAPGSAAEMQAHLLYLCAHLAISHPDQPRLLWLYDLRLLLDRAGPDLTWEALSAQASLLGWESTVQSSLALAAQRIGVRLPQGFPLADSAALERAVQPPNQAPWVRQAWRAFSPTERMSLLWGLLFPAGEYMRWKYHPRPDWLWPLWYPKRWVSMAGEYWDSPE